MSASNQPPDKTLVAQALQALRSGNRAEARRLAENAAQLAPFSEDPWLVLTAATDGEESLLYAQKALRAAPSSPRAQKAVQWAAARVPAPPPSIAPAAPVEAAPAVPAVPVEAAPAVPAKPAAAPQPAAPARPAASRSVRTLLQAPPGWLVPLLAVVFVLCLAALFWVSRPMLNVVMAESLSITRPAGALAKLTITPTVTLTPPAPPPPTAPPPAPTTPNPPPPPTETPTATPTDTPDPTETPEPTDEPAWDSFDGHWIDINLSEQMAYAYDGDTLVNSFLVSTGTWEHPTVTGTYAVYVKYRYADMAGPGYYLPDVPYVMYFYKGYGLHGTYWHNNFGTPMSHGCVNFRTSDAAWVFDFVEVGTTVNVHY